MKYFKLVPVLIMLVMNGNVNAQLLTGPESPCVTCEQLNARTEPYNGTWYNPEQSGTGISLDVQNGVAFGAYFGYDDQGKQLWLTFVGDLLPSNESNVMWTLDASLLQFKDGNAFNQTYSVPSSTDYQGQIHLEFTQKNHALYSVDGGDEQNIVPIVFGVTGASDFSEQSTYIIADLYGMWSFVFNINEEIFPDYPNQWGIYSVMLQLDNKHTSLDLDEDGKNEITMFTRYYGPPPEIQPYGRIECELTDNETPIPECVFIYGYGLFGQIGEEERFYFSLGGLGAYRIFGETIDGHTFEAVKVGYTQYQSKKELTQNPIKAIQFAELAGPQSPCATCNLTTERTEPYNGIWYNPDQSGTGFGIDVQNGTAFGAYYGYDEQGQQIWLTFVGTLVASTETNVMWTLDADLIQFENGNSFNNTYQSPETTDYSGQIHIKFTQKNHAIFSVNDGQAQNIVPLVFGTSATADFPDFSSYLLPELKGMWTANYYINWLIPGPYQSFPNQWGYLPRMFEIGDKSIHNEKDAYWVEYPVTAYFDFPNTALLGKIRCEVVDDGLGNSVPDCVFTDNFGILGFPDEPTPEFHFSLGGLGAYRIFGETLDGHTFEAIKIDSTDYTNSGSLN